MKHIETERLDIRELRGAEDFDAVHDYAQDARLCEFLNWGPNTEEDTRAFLDAAKGHQGEIPRQCYELAVVRKDDNKLVGHASLGITHFDHKEGELHCIVSRKYWGKGYASEAIHALLAFGFDVLTLHRLFATVDPENPGAAAMLESNGMQREAHIREHRWIRGQWRDSLMYSLLDYEWEDIKEKRQTTAAV